MFKKKAEGFRDLIATCGGSEAARSLLITEQLPQLVREQVSAIANLKIDKVTVWDTGKNGDGKNSTAEFVSGLANTFPPLHDLARNVGIKMPSFTGEMIGDPAASVPTTPPPTATSTRAPAREKN